MAGSLGTISGQVRLDVAQALAAFAAVRTSSASTSGSMYTAGTRMQTFGRGMAAVGVGMVAAFAVAVKAAADFEKKLDYFGAVNNATAQEMEKVRAKALELGTTTAFSASQVADAFVEMGKAGVSAKDITDGMAEAIINMASAADIDLTSATNIVTSQIQAYSMAASDAAHVTDVMAGAANASIIDVQDLGVSLKYVGGVAHGLGISFDSTVDAISLLGKAGIKGSTAGTSLRQIMVSLAGGTNKAKGVLEELGIITEDGGNKFFTAEGKAKSLSEVFQILQDHTADLTQKERLMAFRTIFNNRALAAAAILTKEGAKGFAEMNGEISKTTAADVAAKRLDNLAGDVQKLKGTFQTLMIEAGTPFQEFLRGIVQGITNLLQGFMRLPAGVQQGIMSFLLIGGVLLAFMGTTILIVGTVMRFVATLRTLWASVKLVWAVVKTAMIAFRALSMTLLASPITWIVLAVIALAVAFYLLWTRSETFRNVVKGIGSAIKTGFLAVVEWFKGLPKWFSDRWKDISSAFSTGIEWVKKNWDILLALLTGPFGLVVLVWRRFGDDIVSFFQSIPGAITSFASSAWAAITGFFGKLPYYIGFIIGFLIGQFVAGLIQIGTTIASWSVTAYNAIVGFFTRLPGVLANFFTSMYNNFIAFTVNFYNGAVSWGTNTYNAIVTWFQKLPGRIAAYFINMWNNARTTWTNFRNGATNFAVSSYNSIVNWFNKLPGRVASFLIDMKNRAVSAWNSTVSSARNFGLNVYNGFVNWVKKIPGAVNGAINNAIAAFNNMVSSAFNAASDFASGLWDGFKSGLGINSPSLIEKQMWQITSVTETETRRLGTHVRMMQNMYGTISKNNPAAAASTMNTQTLSSLTRSMVEQARVLDQAGRTIFPTGQLTMAQATGAIRGTANASATASGLAESGRNINVTVNNPIAERASDTTARKLRQLSDMGAL